MFGQHSPLMWVKVRTRKKVISDGIDVRFEGRKTYHHGGVKERFLSFRVGSVNSLLQETLCFLKQLRSEGCKGGH